MTAAGFQSLLARLLVEPDLRAELLDPAADLDGRFGLSQAEWAAVQALDAAALEFTAGGIRRARLRTLHRIFAPTLGLLADEQAAACLEELVDRHPPAEAADDPAKWLGEGRQLLALLARHSCNGRLPPATADSARLDLARAELRYDHRAARSAAEARAAAAGGRWVTPAPADRAILSDRVRVVAFDHDVVAMRRSRQLAGVAAEPTFLLLVLEDPGGDARISRLDAAAHRTLSWCDGTTTLAELTGDDEQAGAVLAQAAQRWLIERVPT